MPNHPNRGPKGSNTNPTPSQIKEMRESLGLTQTQAAKTIYSTLRTWQGWEAPSIDQGSRRMHPALWELFLIKTGK